MFCMMDVSGSMDEHKKVNAKLFYMCLYKFLQRNYDKVDVVFLRHTTTAEEVDEVLEDVKSRIMKKQELEAEEIGEAVKGISPALLNREPDLPWAQIAGMRDQLAHRYFDTSRAMLGATVDHDLPELQEAVARLLDDA